MPQNNYREFSCSNCGTQIFLHKFSSLYTPHYCSNCKPIFTDEKRKINEKKRIEKLKEERANTIYFCENCGKKFTGDYRSCLNKDIPRFCSRECSNSFSSKSENNQKQKSATCIICGKDIFVNIHTSLSVAKCEQCQKEYSKKKHKESHKKERIKKLKEKEIIKDNKNFLKIKEYNSKLLFDKDLKEKDVFTCPYCGRYSTTKSGNSTHSKYCKENPNYISAIGHPHTEDFKKNQSLNAQKNHLGGWHTGRKVWYKGVLLGSSYEEILVKDLDKNNIKWEKPSYFKWVSPIDNKEHRYYPDIYLPDYNIYFDPKNDYLIENENPRFGMSDLDKIKLVESQNNIKVFVLNKEQLTWNYIKNNIILD